MYRRFQRIIALANAVVLLLDHSMKHHISAHGWKPCFLSLTKQPQYNFHLIKSDPGNFNRIRATKPSKCAHLSVPTNRSPHDSALFVWTMQHTRTIRRTVCKRWASPVQPNSAFLWTPLSRKNCSIVFCFENTKPYRQRFSAIVSCAEIHVSTS